MASNPLTLYHQHIPKSGGTSLNRFLKRNLKSCHWFPKKDHRLKVRNIPGLYQIDKDYLNRYNCFHGHWGNFFFNQFKRKVDVHLVSFRDPVEHLCSRIHWTRKMMEIGNFRPKQYSKIHKFFFKQSTFHRLLEKEDYFTEIIDNLHKLKDSGSNPHPYLFYLGLKIPNEKIPTSFPKPFVRDIWRNYSDQSIDDLYQESKKTIDNLSMILVLEDFDNSFKMLGDLLNLPNQIDHAMHRNKRDEKNTTKFRYKDTLHEEQIQRIEEFVAMDIKIYNYAMEKYALQKKKYADILQKS
jgi:hypothetical protein